MTSKQLLAHYNYRVTLTDGTPTQDPVSPQPRRLSMRSKTHFSVYIPNDVEINEEY